MMLRASPSEPRRRFGCLNCRMVTELVNTEPVEDVGARPPLTFDDLFAERYQPMVRLATLLVGNEAIGEELVQDAFVRVHHKWPTIEHPAAYVRTAVVNACRNNRRRARLERAHARTDASTVAPPQDPLVDAIATLNERQRVAIVLRYYEDLSEAEIADAIGCRPGTVKSLLSRGLAQLREVIEP
jgi:RNA polymerase sigma-70 factor (sigma-E family)